MDKIKQWLQEKLFDTKFCCKCGDYISPGEVYTETHLQIHRNPKVIKTNYYCRKHYTFYEYILFGDPKATPLFRLRYDQILIFPSTSFQDIDELRSFLRESVICKWNNHFAPISDTDIKQLYNDGQSN